MNTVQRKLLETLPETLDLSLVTTVLIPLCFGDPEDPDDGCHDRFNEAVRRHGHIFNKTLIIQTGGTKENPLCDKMLNVVKKNNRYLWALRFLSIPLGWGTRAEIANAFSIIEVLSKPFLENGINVEHSKFKVVISSNRTHMTRIRWYVRIHNTSNLPIEFAEADHKFGFKNTLREWIGTPLIKLKDLFLGRENLIYRQEQNFSNKF